jgi:hypothetical protein
MFYYQYLYQTLHTREFHDSCSFPRDSMSFTVHCQLVYSVDSDSQETSYVGKNDRFCPVEDNFFGFGVICRPNTSLQRLIRARSRRSSR